MKVILNAQRLPEVYFGLHMVEGVAEYAEHDNRRIYINENTIKNMDPSFKGKPVYVNHVDGVDLKNLQTEADGYVIRSFFNEADGKHWCEFIVVSDAGHQAIKNGWKLSNAYLPVETSSGGECHGVQYDEEVTRGEYEHLAIVQDPRYQESDILTPAQFKVYNENKKAELLRLTNSKKGKLMALKLFKRAKIENAAALDLENTMVELPKTKREVSISTLVNEADEKEEKKKDMMCNMDHHVMFGEKKMKVGDLVNAHQEMCNKMAEYENADGGADDATDEDADAANDQSESGEMGQESDGDLEMNEADGDKAADEKVEKKADKGVSSDMKKNAKALADARALVAAADAKAKKKNGKSGTRTFFDDLRSAPDKVLQNEAVIDLPQDRVSRGQSKYGSN